MNTLRVIARGDGTVPYVDEAGRFHPARAYGRGADGAPAAEPVPDTSYVRRAIARGDLAEVAEEVPQDPPAPADDSPAAPNEES